LIFTLLARVRGKSSMRIVPEFSVNVPVPRAASSPRPTVEEESVVPPL